MLTIDVDVQLESQQITIPQQQKLVDWLNFALQSNACTCAEITIRVVDEEEMCALNTTYRHKEGPTNVLSFTYCSESDETDDPLMGDLVLCAPVIAQEARQHDKSLEAHWAHLIVHGSLHLLGFDHKTNAQAEEMEALEIKLLAQLGYPNPYPIQHGDTRDHE